MYLNGKGRVLGQLPQLAVGKDGFKRFMAPG
jgi:hypothetical protein